MKGSLVFDGAMELIHHSSSLLINDKYQNDANRGCVCFVVVTDGEHTLSDMFICFISKLLNKVQAVMLKRQSSLEPDEQLKTLTVQEMC